MTISKGHGLEPAPAHPQDVALGSVVEPEIRAWYAEITGYVKAKCLHITHVWQLGQALHMSTEERHALEAILGGLRGPKSPLEDTTK